MKSCEQIHTSWETIATRNKHKYPELGQLFCNKCTKVIQWGKEDIFHKWFVNNWANNMEKGTSTPISHYIYKLIQAEA